MKIFIEGCDGVGKSTVAKQLQELTGYQIIQGSNFEMASKGVDHMFETMKSIAQMDNVIVDRFFWSNTIYGKLFSKNMLSKEQRTELLKLIDTSESMTLFLMASLDVIIERINVRGDDDITTDDISPILDKYLELLLTEEDMPINHADINTDNYVSDEALKFFCNI